MFWLPQSSLVWMTAESTKRPSVSLPTRGDSVPPISITLAYILAHGPCHWLRAGRWTKCHRVPASTAAASSRSDETEMNHNDVHSCSFQRGSAHDLFPSSCDFSGGTTFKDHKSCKCHQSLTKAICPESSSLQPSRRQLADRALLATVYIPHCASISPSSSWGGKMVRKLRPSAWSSPWGNTERSTVHSCCITRTPVTLFSLI